MSNAKRNAEQRIRRAIDEARERDVRDITSLSVIAEKNKISGLMINRIFSAGPAEYIGWTGGKTVTR